MTGVTCKPGCMGSEGNLAKNDRRASSYARQRQEHDAAAIRRTVERAREAAHQTAAGALRELEAKWGTRADALSRLSRIGQSLGQLRLEQDALLLERDQLIAHLRQAGESWNSLVARTGQSRQALSKRTPTLERE